MSDSTIMTRLRSRQKQAIIIVSLSSSSKPLIKRIIHPIELKRGPSIIMASLLFLLSIKNLDLSVKYVIAKIQILLIMATTILSFSSKSAGGRRPSGASPLPRPLCFQPQIATKRWRWDKEFQPYPTFEGYLHIKFSQPKISDSPFYFCGSAGFSLGCLSE